MKREYDITLFGATGFTGSKTAAYLAAHAPEGLRWAIAGRSQQKLDAVKQALAARGGRVGALGTVVADVDDPGSLQRMAARTRVLLTTVGPFIDYGEPLVHACVEQGTDYIDSTGEPHFVQLLLARYAEPAARSGVRVVPSCGFDSIPADLGALFTVQQLPADQPIRLSGYMQLKGTFSGGTERSAIKSLVPPKDSISAPPPSPASGRRVRLQKATIARRPELGGWASPMETVDGPIVVRSAAASARYGPDFSYAHHALHASLPLLIAALLFFGSLALFARIAPLRALMLKLAKKPGEGPTEEQMRENWFALRFVAECGERIVQTEVRGGDPGYGETSKMLAEAALCLALDRDDLPARAGVLTPAEAMGDALLARLQRAGLSFRVLSG